jgi:hypothetical protein
MMPCMGIQCVRNAVVESHSAWSGASPGDAHRFARHKRARRFSEPQTAAIGWSLQRRCGEIAAGRGMKRRLLRSQGLGHARWTDGTIVPGRRLRAGCVRLRVRRSPGPTNRLECRNEIHGFLGDNLYRRGPSLVSVHLDSHDVRSSPQFPIDERCDTY